LQGVVVAFAVQHTGSGTVWFPMADASQHPHSIAASPVALHIEQSHASQDLPSLAHVCEPATPPAHEQLCVS
jgi:hypothetical protein